MLKDYKQVVFVEAKPGDRLDDFVWDLFKLRQIQSFDIAGVFNDRVLKVDENTTYKDIMKQFSKYD